MEAEIPKFIKLRGCINCEVSKSHKKRTGYDYGFHHEIILGCLISGCMNYGHAIYKPFFDPEELIKEANKLGKPEYMEKARRYLLSVKKRFGKFYEKIGVNLENLLENSN